MHSYNINNVFGVKKRFSPKILQVKNVVTAYIDLNHHYCFIMNFYDDHSYFNFERIHRRSRKYFKFN